MSTDVDRFTAGVPVAGPARVGQATAVEQSRAVAEVQAAAALARSFPRDVPAARQRVLDACSQLALAERAFFRYSRGGSQVTGPSIQLAKELARCWGNITYEVAELDRDDVAGRSEMVAWAWDLETNARPSVKFIVPHVRTGKGAKALDDPRDVYENNANNGARRLREQILSVLPQWLVEEAKAACVRTLENPQGAATKPLDVRIGEATEAFHKRWKVQREQLERKLGRQVKDWTAGDLATLMVVYTSLDRGEVSLVDEFPESEVTGADVVAQASSSRRRPARVEQAPVVEDPPGGEDYDPTTEPGFGGDQ